ncbi:MAG: hypothetical protein B7X64_03100 [Halothiobacillus sp. 39-53-45]|jgi:hypothetical protein|nr:MAG: hypothetical protein B7X64_03100 [Halothiobacillus sp. 39-53-45]
MADLYAMAEAMLDQPPAPDEQERKSQASMIVEFVESRCELFHDLNRDPFATQHETGATMRLDSRSFKDWLSSSFYAETGNVPRSQSVSEAAQTLSGIARYRGEQHPVFLRVGQHGSDYWLDLCDQQNSRAVRLSAGSWEVVDKPPVRFTRTEAMQQLPIPKRGGSIDALWRQTNIPTDKRVLIVAWLIECYRHDTPFPVLELFGEQGSAKSTTQTALRRLIDPNACNLRTPPAKIDDMFIGAGANWITSFENVSHLSSPMQDALCILSTGGGIARRKLYSDADESVINVRRPVVLNGISICVTAQDLVDRTISVELPTITDRQESNAMQDTFDKEIPSILGGLLDIAADALALLPSITIPKDQRPRLIEFARLGAAIGQVIGQDFMAAFTVSREDAVSRTIDASPVAAALLDWFDGRERRGITDTVKSLFEQVERYRPQGAEAWPRSPKGFSDALRRAAPALRQMGIECRNEGKTGGVVRWSVTEIKVSKQCPESPACPDFDYWAEP